MFDPKILMWLIIFFGLLSGFITVLALGQLKKNNPGGITPWLLPFGIFVWGDGLILGLFWFFVSLFVLWTNNWQLFFLIYLLFWMVRSSGEVLYWFMQQFSAVVKDPPETLWLSKLMPGESVWFGYQLIWQCVFVISSIGFIYLVQIVL
jgi:hypothetical protein